MVRSSAWNPKGVSVRLYAPLFAMPHANSSGACACADPSLAVCWYSFFLPSTLTQSRCMHTPRGDHVLSQHTARVRRVSMWCRPCGTHQQVGRHEGAVGVAADGDACRVDHASASHLLQSSEVGDVTSCQTIAAEQDWNIHIIRDIVVVHFHWVGSPLANWQLTCQNCKIVHNTLSQTRSLCQQHQSHLDGCPGAGDQLGHVGVVGLGILALRHNGHGGPV